MKTKEDEQASLQSLQRRIVEFRDARDWGQFHDPKNLAISLSLEANELLELFLWKDAAQAAPARVSDELADVIHTALLIADHYDIDISQACSKKLEQNEQKYPVEVSKGKNLKYTELMTD